MLTMICASACLATAASAKGPAVTTAQPSPALGAASTWQPARPEEVKTQVFAWLDGKKADPALRARCRRFGPTCPATRARKICWRGSPLRSPQSIPAPRSSWSDVRCRGAECCFPRKSGCASSSVPPLLGNNLRLLYARWLMDEALYDEASEQLKGLDASNVVAPALLLFCRGVAFHALLNKDSSLKSLDQLLQGAELSPKRYVAVARLMQEDLKNLQEEGLDHIARRMSDIRRRLDLGRAGSKVRQVEDGVIESLDKLIKNLEQQQQQQSQTARKASVPRAPHKTATSRAGRRRAT